MLRLKYLDPDVNEKIISKKEFNEFISQRINYNEALSDFMELEFEIPQVIIDFIFSFSNSFIFIKDTYKFVIYEKTMNSFDFSPFYSNYKYIECKCDDIRKNAFSLHHQMTKKNKNENTILFTREFIPYFSLKTLKMNATIATWIRFVSYYSLEDNQRRCTTESIYLELKIIVKNIMEIFKDKIPIVFHNIELIQDYIKNEDKIFDFNSYKDNIILTEKIGNKTFNSKYEGEFSNFLGSSDDSDDEDIDFDSDDDYDIDEINHRLMEKYRKEECKSIEELDKFNETYIYCNNIIETK